jgi:multiple sugar transport system substrate-binding protein
VKISNQQTNGKFSKPHRIVALIIIGVTLLLIVTACQPQFGTPPRLATIEARSMERNQATAEPMNIPAPTPTDSPPENKPLDSSTATELEVWINETSTEHRQAVQSLADDYSNRTGVEVALQFISPALLPDLAATAVISDTLPDVILLPLEFTVLWSENGILDATVADAVIDELGRDTFDQGALDLVDVSGQSAAIPSDGYQQFLLYRSDWFEENRLDVPDNYDDMIAAAEALFDPDNLIYGLVIPTESNLINTQRAFEHFALANNCQLIDESGEILLLEPECRDALDFYYAIVNQYSPPGVQTDTSARNAFLDGRTAMIMSSPSILPDLVMANRLDRNTGIITNIRSDVTAEESANFGNITYLGITSAADPAAASFANYWFNEGYPTWLEIESERKVPMRLGTIERPRYYIDDWGNSPILQGENLDDIVGPQVVEQLRSGIGSTNRWGFRQGQGELIGKIYDELTFSVVLQEMLSGYFNSAKTIFEAYNRVIDLIPDYSFPIVPTPEPGSINTEG